ncbi:aspartic peptidase domain-containing protein [Mycena filopes]|nr:aspartic peptidase domain-containing protein [Mycena filopes]
MLSPLALFLSFAIVRQSFGLTLCASPISHSVRDSQTGASLQSLSNINYTDAGGTLAQFPFRYATNITLNAQDFKVAIDTGSSDLWVKPSPSHDFSFNDTGTPITEVYGGGNVSGTIGFASARMGGYSYDNQSFINATVDDVGIVLVGLDGLIGLSFTGAIGTSDGASQIVATVVQNGSDPNSVQPFLFNIFAQTPEQNNFIGISLSRTDDLEGSADASFTINEVDETYADVLNAPVLPLFDVSPGPSSVFGAGERRWRILVDAIEVDGVNVSMPASVAGAPAGKLVTVMDTGSPFGSIPTDLFNTIYSSIPGAKNTVQNGVSGWLIPCNTTSIVSVWIGGQPFPIHPLDLSDVGMDPDTNSLICASTFDPFDGVPTVLDIIFGDTFLRNVYSIFNFGDAISNSPTGKASMQLLSQTNATAAIADVLNVRMASLLPQLVLKIPSDMGNTSAPAPAPGAVAAADLIDAGRGSEDDDATVKKYAPIVIGLLGGNLLVVLLLLVLGLIACLKPGGKNGGGRYAPVRVVIDDETRPLDHGLADKPYSD